MMINQSNYDETEDSALDEIRNQGLKENNALRVYTYLRANERARSRRLPRWIWELLQNAHDASIAREEPLIVNIKYSPGELVFSHNGSSFEAKQIFNLIYHGSTKADEEEAIGEYGSGFLTTHLLSPEIKVSGQLDDKQNSRRRFDFCLTRKSDSSDELLELMDEAWDDFKESLLSNQELSMPDSFTTQFVYPIVGVEAEEAVEKGIETLKQCAPFVVVFNPKFSVIDINNHGETLCFEAIEHLSMNTAEIQEITVEERKNENSNKNKYLLALGGDKKTSVAVPLESNSNGSVCQSVENIPRLFKAFPLVGTEFFSFPAIINSFKFTPTEDRNGVQLGLNDTDPENIENQAIIEEACTLLVHLLQFSASKGWYHVHRWAKIPVIQNKDWLNTEWIKTCIKGNLIAQIRQTPAVLNADDNPIAPRQAKIPLAESEVSVQILWDLFGALMVERKFLPRREEAIGWCDVIKSWSDVYQGEPIALFNEGRNGPKLVSALEKFLERHGGNRIESLQNLLREDVSAGDWLNQLYDFLNGNGFGNEIHSRRFVLDQSGGFNQLSKLYRDIGIDQELKEIAELFGWHIRLELRSTQLTSLVEEIGLGDRNSEYIVEDLIRLLQERASQNPDSNFKRVSVRLFAWIVRQDQKDWNRLRNVPVFTEDSTCHPSLSSVSLPNEPPLAPIRAWPEDLQQFSELFPPDRILDDSFFEAIPDTDLWQMLCEQDVIRRNMITRWLDLRNLKPFSPEVYENEDDGGDHESEEVFSAIGVIAWEAIMEKVRNSRDTAYLFWRFLTEYLIAMDSAASLEEKAARCKSCGEIHKYYLSIWLKAVRSNKWIRQGDLRFYADAQSLANLLREKGWKLHSLENPTTVKLLNAIDVPPSDLRFELITGSPEARDALVNTMTELHQITGGDLSQVNAIVQHVQKIEGDLTQTLEVIQHMQEDENFSEYFAERQEQTRRVHENQYLGAQVENLVKVILRDNDFKVKRTGTGSDFEITLNVSRNDQSWLIEVKSTRQDGDHQSVSMTSTQAQTAEKEKEKFLLCVVPLEQEYPTEENVKEKMLFIQNIGARIAPLREKLDKLTDYTSTDLELKVEKKNVRVLVKKSLWDREGFSLTYLLEYLK